MSLGPLIPLLMCQLQEVGLSMSTIWSLWRDVQGFAAAELLEGVKITPRWGYRKRNP